MSELETIRYEVEGPVATITLARPDQANAQSMQLIGELDAAFDLADADDDVRVVVLAAAAVRRCIGHDPRGAVGP
ncbi:MAG: enoyl-CoA hydratase-related protein [Acidimicrobiia bacterium]|nr:enoyl-CoA hydratase-related protein [Acidimicrobiia bacterium]